MTKELSNKRICVTAESQDRIRALKVSPSIHDEEIIEMLLDTYEKYVRIMDNDMDDGR